MLKFIANAIDIHELHCWPIVLGHVAHQLFVDK